MSKHPMNEDRRALLKAIMLTPDETQQVAAGLLLPVKERFCGGSGPFIPWGPDLRHCPIFEPRDPNPPISF
jgi:hypothetical protein